LRIETLASRSIAKNQTRLIKKQFGKEKGIEKIELEENKL
jgi:hypothetical protein